MNIMQMKYLWAVQILVGNDPWTVKEYMNADVGV